MPLFEVTDTETGRIVIVEGDSAPTQEESARITAETGPPPIETSSLVAEPPKEQEDLGFAGAIGGTARLGASILSQAVIQPIAGLRGASEAIQSGSEAGAQTIADIQEFGRKPFGEDILGESGRQVAGRLGEAAQDVAEFAGPIIGGAFKFAGDLFEQAKEAAFQKFGPVGGAAVAALPTTALELVPALSAMKKAKNIPVTLADEVIEEIGDQTRATGTPSLKTEIPSEAKSVDNIVSDLRKDDQKAAERIAGQVEPDPAIVKAAADLGVVINPEAYSTNIGFIEVMQALKSRAGSKIRQSEFKSIEDVGKKADEFIEEIGGTLDKSLLDSNVRTQMDNNIKRLENLSDKLYARVEKSIPPATRVNPSAATSYIERRLNDLGGNKSLLKKSERMLLNFATQERPPTYAALDQVRRDVGDALGKQTGEFRDDTTRILNNVYAVLSDDQIGVAVAFGVGARYAAARKLISQRKDLEANAKKLFDRNLAGSIVPKLAAAAVKLTKGDISLFRKLVDALPLNQRGPAVATMLNEFFAAGQGKKRALGGGFRTAFEALNRHPQLKRAIFEQLPKGAEKKFNDLGKVTTGIFRAKSFENNSKSGRDILLALDNGTLYAKLREGAIKEATLQGVGAVLGVPIITSAARTLTGELAKKSKTPISDAADELLSSPQFSKALEDASTGKDLRGDKLSKTKAAVKWLTAQPPDIRAEVLAIGLIPFLTAPDDPGLSEIIQEVQ